MARPVQVSLYKKPTGVPFPPNGVVGAGPSVPYDTETDWINPDAVVDVKTPGTPPAASYSYYRHSAHGNVQQRNEGVVDCALVHLASHNTGSSHDGRNIYPENVAVVVGTVPDVLDLLWPPTEPNETGISLVVSAGQIEIEGLRAGSQTRYMLGEIAHLDARLLRGAYWQIAPLAAGTTATWKVLESKHFTLQAKQAIGTWADVTNNATLTARTLYRVKPAPAPTE